MEAGVYWIELVIDDDFNPDFDAYPQKLMRKMHLLL